MRVLFQISWALAEVKVRMGENTRDLEEDVESRCLLRLVGQSAPRAALGLGNVVRRKPPP